MGFVPGKNLHLKCIEADCGSVFGTFSGFRKHLHTKHAEQSDGEQNFDTTDKVTVSKILTPLIAMRLPRQIDKVVLEYLIRLAVLERWPQHLYC